MTVGRLTIDTSRSVAIINGVALRLSALEYRLLDLLAHSPGRVFTATEIAEQLHGAADASDANAIEALVLRLRRKIGPSIVETRRGFGYTLAGS
jgi:DNA-binding response OmpR family regulator